MSTTDILDLDVLIPSPCKIRINGKEIDAHPLTLKQLIRITNIQTEISQTKNTKEMYDTIIDSLSPMIPALKTDPTLDFSLDQLYAIIEFAQKISLPKNIATETKEITPKKKVSSPGP